MGCEKSAITMTLFRLSYLVHSLGNYTMTLTTETETNLKSIFSSVMD